MVLYTDHGKEPGGALSCFTLYPCASLPPVTTNRWATGSNGK